MQKLVAGRWERKGTEAGDALTYCRAASRSLTQCLESSRVQSVPQANQTRRGPGCGSCELLHSLSTSFLRFSPATVGQEHQVWAAATQCHSHEEGRQRRGQPRRGPAPGQSHGICDSAGHHPPRPREQSEAPQGKDVTANNPESRWAVDRGRGKVGEAFLLSGPGRGLRGQAPSSAVGPSWRGR